MQGLPGSVDTGATRTESLAAPAAKKPKKRHDKSQQDKVLQQLHDSPAFCILVEHQQRLDDLISQRRAAIREALAKPDRLRSRVRITITHVLHPAESGEPPSWSLLIHGRTLDNVDAGSASNPTGQTAANIALAQHINAAADELIKRGASEADVGRMRMQLALQTGGPQALAALAAGTTPAAAPATKHPLTSYLRRVEVKLLPPSAPAAPATAAGGAGAMDADGPGAQAMESTGAEGSDGARVLVWDRSLHLGAHKDCIEVRLQGVGAFEAGARASVTLTLDGQPERFLLPAPLDTLLGVPMETKPRMMQLLGMYIRKERLMDVEQMVTLRGQLAEALGVTSLSYQQLQAEILKRLQPVPPLHVDHLITPLRGAPVSAASQATVFDVECETLGPINPATEKQAAGLFESLNPDKELEPVEGEMATALKRLAEHRRRRAMLMGLAQSPVDFTASILATQARELRIVKGSTSVVQIAQHLQAAQPGRTNLQLEPTIALAAATVSKEFEVQRYTELFKGKWVEDAAVAYLSKAGQVANVFNAAFGGR